MPAAIALVDAAATERLGAIMATHLPEMLDVHLHGDLGAGKSTLVRAVLTGLGHAGPVPSPTYTLVEAYRTERAAVQHLDLYRLADPEELEYIGWRDYLAEPAVRFIEWPERAEGYLGRPDLMIHLTVVGRGRLARMTGLSEPAMALVDAVASAWMARPVSP